MFKVAPYSFTKITYSNYYENCKKLLSLVLQF